MADTTTRTLWLLSLLQRRRYWPGLELAVRLEVSDRTLRRDIDRLRDLGYTVDSERGVDGGYRLAGGAGNVMLLLDDDETTALAVALHSATGGTGDLADASLGALSKVVSMLRPEQRARVDAIRSTTTGEPFAAATAPQLTVLDAVATSCRDGVRLGFDYVAADGTKTNRYVEAHEIVTVGVRWYLVAFDTDRADWRTFRVDRITDPVPARNAYPTRPAPADDLHAYVRSSFRGTDRAHRVVIDIETNGDRVREAFGRWVEVEDVDEQWCRLTMDADSFVWPVHIITALDAPFVVIEPADLRAHLASLRDRIDVALRS